MHPPVLIVSPYLPFPTRFNGLSVRLSPVIKDLSSSREVHLLVVGQNRQQVLLGEEEARWYCGSVSMIEPPKNAALVRMSLARSLLTPPIPPRRLLFANTAQALREIARIQDQRQVSTILFLGDLLSHAAVVTKRRTPKVRCVVDWVDSPSLHAARILKQTSTSPSRTGEAIARWERIVNAKVDAAIYISASDALHANRELGERVRVLPNGLVDDFPVERESHWREALSMLPKLTIGFLGNMGYEPNDEAAQLLCRKYLPQLQAEFPGLDVRVKIVGKGATQDLTSLSGPKVEITGEVEEIWTHLEEVDVFVFPMLRGAGMQNKVMEAMRSRRPVIASGLCVAGLPTMSEHYALVADDPDAAVKQVRKLIANEESLRKGIEKNLSYVRSLSTSRMVTDYISCLRAGVVGR